MRLPNADAHYSRRVDYGFYVVGRLRRARFANLSADVEKLTRELKKAGRDAEDAREAVIFAMAERDGIDGDLDFAAQSARAELAGRGVDASKAEPYISIFDKGIDYYIAAPVGQQNARYNELIKRMEEHLPAADTLRVATVDTVVSGLAAYDTAVKALDDARAKESMLMTALERAEEAWDRQLERTFGALVAELGRTRANGFFPRVGKRSRKPGSDD